MRRKQTKAIEAPQATAHESIPALAFELALYRMRYTQDSTRAILTDYLKELGA
jgi:hypothetical protein